MQPEKILQLIQSRRTCYQTLSKAQAPVVPADIQTCLQAAIYAPNHKLTQPWVFWVMGAEFQNKFAHIYADNRAQKKATLHSDDYKCLYDKALAKFLAIPQVILVGQKLAENAIVQKEDYAACCCAIQNFQLMAWSLQIGVQWSTGPIISDRRSYDLLAINPKEVELMGALYIGNIDADCAPNHDSKRKPLAEVTVHLD